ncbi:MAG: protein jag [Clostridia bacterium]|nr:protein jag [Clostridia bacterium]
MEKTIIAEGKTTKEAIENGLKQLNVTKDCVDIKVLESEDKRSFYSILAPRIVKVEITVKEERTPQGKQKREIHLSQEEEQQATEKLEKFLKEFIKQLPEGTKYEITSTENYINVNIISENLGYLIGYRGETLYALQNILSAIAGKGIEKRIKVILDIGGYKEKREKTLEDLASKVAKTVIRTGKPIKLEPMQAYERKIIHSKLQKNSRVETTSIGEEPYRRIVVSLKEKY